MAATIKVRHAVFGIGVFATLSGGSHAASYAEILFEEKFEVHIREMVAGIISRKNADYIAYISFDPTDRECTDHTVLIDAENILQLIDCCWLSAIHAEVEHGVVKTNRQ